MATVGSPKGPGHAARSQRVASAARPWHTTHLWGKSWRDPNEPIRATVRDRFLALSGAALECLDDPGLRGTSRGFLGLLLPRVVDVPMYGTSLDPDRDRRWGTELAFEGLPAHGMEDRLEEDASFGVACARADADLGLSSPDRIDPAICLLWELYSELVLASDVGGRAGRFAQFVAEAAYYWMRRGEPGINDAAEVFAEDSAQFGNSVEVSTVHMLGRIVARIRMDSVPRSDHRVQVLYRRQERKRPSTRRFRIRRRSKANPRPG
jgi:hypothetical protein